ncbi:MAG TPA: MFS transporter [Candidatus Dojkabacteria bacterium]|nr:MFS transporter [Candidatus Dojkabacteria bacterium]
MEKHERKRPNKVVMLLTLSDMLSWGPFLIISALSGIYLSDKLGVDAVKFVGIGTSIYFFTRAILQIPMGYLTDKIESDKDEILLLAAGTILMGLPYTFYPHITEPWHYYLLQFVFGFGVALSVTNWRKLFAMNVDSGIEGLQYGFYETIISLFTAGLSILIGSLASLNKVYFDFVIVSAGIVMMLGSLAVLAIFTVEKRKSHISNNKKGKK